MISQNLQVSFGAEINSIRAEGRTVELFIGWFFEKLSATCWPTSVSRGWRSIDLSFCIHRRSNLSMNTMLRTLVGVKGRRSGERRPHVSDWISLISASAALITTKAGLVIRA